MRSGSREKSQLMIATVACCLRIENKIEIKHWIDRIFIECNNNIEMEAGAGYTSHFISLPAADLGRVQNLRI